MSAENDTPSDESPRYVSFHTDSDRAHWRSIDVPPVLLLDTQASAKTLAGTLEARIDAIYDLLNILVVGDAASETTRLAELLHPMVQEARTLAEAVNLQIAD